MSEEQARIEAAINGVGPQSIDELGASDQARLRAVMRDGWRLTPATLGHKITNGRWIAARHLLHISTIIATEIAKGDARIILTMPARHGKSEFLSVNTPIWFLEKWPGKFVMTISYGSELATDFSLKVRDTLQDPDLHHLLRTRIRQDKKRVDRWLTPNGGGLTAAGIGGPLTGRGADLMLIDDYIKNAEASMSDSQRKSTWEWFKSTAYTRLEPGASLVILATRWHRRDLIGMCLDEMPDENWLVINLPALALPGDPLGREVGEALWPERFDEARLHRIKKALGTYWWEAMYQQKPLASMGGLEIGSMIKKVREADLPHWSELIFLRSWDPAATKDGGDWTAGPKMARHKSTGRVYVIDMQRFQKSSHGVDTMMLACAEGDGHGVPIWIEQEPGSSGVVAINHYKSILTGYSVNSERATGPLPVRASPFLAACEAGNIYMVEADWNEELILEVNGFGDDPEHDDQIAALSQGYNKLVKGSMRSLTWGRGSEVENVHDINEARTSLPVNPKNARARASKLTW